MKRIVGYVRVSTKRQEQKGWGVAAQKAAIKKYAERHGARLLKIYVERDHGDNAHRPIADLDGRAEILPEHVSEAVNYRVLDRQFWS